MQSRLSKQSSTDTDITCARFLRLNRKSVSLSVNLDASCPSSASRGPVIEVCVNLVLEVAR